MKKIYLILFFIALSFYMLYGTVLSNKLKNIQLNLKEDEIAVVMLSLENSKSLLIKVHDEFILYTFLYQEDEILEQQVSLFTDSVNYVFTDASYPLSYPYKIILEGTAIIGGIQLQPNKIYYRDYVFCINVDSDCDFLYLTEELEISKEIGVVFYDEGLSATYIDTLHEKWMDVYKVTNQMFVIMLLGEDYEVLYLEH